MREFDYIIVGGGLAAVSAVEGIRERDPDGSIVVFCEEAEPPYHRPPLSKEYLQVPEATRDLLHVKPEGWYEESGEVELELETAVVDLDPAGRRVATADGEEVRAERILLATGGRPRLLDLPGVHLPGVFTLRTVEDSEALREAARETEDALLVGAGFIGMELAASFRKFDVTSTVVEREERVWGRALPPALSSFVQEYFEARGVRFRLNSEVREFRGDGELEAAVLEDGSEVPCSLAVVGVGIEPADALARHAGLAVDDGVVVDRYGETSHGWIYATGDVARFPDPVFGDPVRIEHWDHARVHGRLVGRNMAGGEEEYGHLSHFFSDVFDLSLNVVGRPAGANRVVTRGDLEDGGGVALCGRDGRLCGAVLVNATDHLEDCRRLVARRPGMDEIEARVKDPERDLAEVARR